MYGWFSKKQYDLSGGVIYKDAQGKDILVTQVTKNETTTTSRWDDLKPLGIVGKYVRDAGRMTGKLQYVSERGN